MKRISVLLVSAACLCSFACLGADTVKANPYKSSLQAVMPAELPTKAAEIVEKAKANHRKEATAGVVKAVVEVNPAATPATVGAIARAVPEMAAEAASLATAERPQLAAAIARAAAGGAPSQAAKIVTAVCKAAPNLYRQVAVAVAEVVPGAGKDILSAVAAAIPELKPAIESAMAGYTGTPSSVGAALDQVKATPVARKETAATPGLSTTPLPLGSAPQPARGPSVGPPYIPLSQTPTNVTPGTGGEVPPGGRNYAAP